MGLDEEVHVAGEEVGTEGLGKTGLPAELGDGRRGRDRSRGQDEPDEEGADGIAEAGCEGVRHGSRSCSRSVRISGNVDGGGRRGTIPVGSRKNGDSSAALERAAGNG